MASPISKTSYHARSISLPQRSHPVADQLDEELCRLKSSQAASTSSSSLSDKLSSLNNLYHCVDELLQLPLTQQTLSQSLRAQCIEEVFDGSLRLLDICETSRDALLQSKESLQDIQSVLRRRYSGELTIPSEFIKYLNTRKITIKAIKKCLKSIKENENNEDNSIVGKLKDVEAMTIDTFKSLLAHIGGSKSQSKSSWSIVSKLINKSAEKDAAAYANEFDAVDATLDSLVSQKKKSGINMIQVEVLRNQMTELESEIQDLDEALDCLSRHLVKTRANLLNILSN